MQPPQTSADRRALLAERLRHRMAERHYPLSYPQQRLWFLDQLDAANAVYVVPLIYRISGRLELAALEHALTEVTARHQALRTVFRPVDGVPRQFIQPAGPVSIPVQDVSQSADPATAARALAGQEARRPFRLEEDLLIRPLLIRLAPGEQWLCLTLHHIACDGWSLHLLDAELSEFYRSFLAGEPASLPPLPLQYADLAERQVEQLAGQALDTLTRYWRERLDGAPALASLPADYPRPVSQSHAGDHLDFRIDAATTEQVSALARATAATPFAVLLAAFAALVHAHTGTTDVIVGSPVANRPLAGMQPLIGFFANTIVQRIDVSGEPTFTELVTRARDESRAALAHSELPFEKLVEELRPRRDPAHNPLFQLMLSYQEAEPAGLMLPGCQVIMVPGDTSTAKFDLTVSITRSERQLAVRLEYSTALFAEQTARDLAEQFVTVLTAAAASPGTRISRLPVLSRTQLLRVTAEANPTAGSVDPALIHELIAAQAQRSPDAPALTGSGPAAGQTLTYRELDDRTAALAARLICAGAGPDVPVGVYLDRSPDLVVALLAVLRSGSAYLPLDPGYPRTRLEFMVRDARTPIIVTRSGLADAVEGTPATVIELDSVAPTGDHAPPQRGAKPHNLAYVIYTSGSTGNPKGVMISHRNVLNFFAGADALLGDDPGNWLAITSMSFDISVLELLWTLARGAHVTVRSDEPAAVAGAADNPVPVSARTRPMDFSLFYFGGDAGAVPGQAYRLMLEGARFADHNGFRAVWTPERHFHEFGGLYPNPSVTSAAIAAITEHVDVRAGSVVIPLHDPLRVAEEWSVVDNLSGGRVGVSLASGWQANDFVLAPGNYADRKKIMLEQLEELRRLWRGGGVRRRNGAGTETEVRIFPRPVSAELPVWVTSARSPETFELAGQAGAGLLTHLLGNTIEQLAGKIELYRKAWRESGHAGQGQVTLMLHTFVGDDADEVATIVREPLCAYIKSSFDLLSGLGQATGHAADLRDLPERELDALVARAFDRFFATSGLLGTPEHCADLVDQLKTIGVDEVACLIDFGVPHEQVIAALGHLGRVLRLERDRRRAALDEESVAAQLLRHRVSHLQCTPSAASLLVEDGQASEALAGLRRLLVGGEALPAPLARQLGELVPGSVHNMYGPTEATVWATTAPVGASGPVTIGRPMTNVRAYVVDAYLRPVPANAPGELLLGGPGIARGYLGRPGLTAERFIPDPFSGEPGGRLYRTGDLVRRRHGGELEFLGRLDDQIKLFGHRIELGEIENVLRGHPDLRAAVAIVRGEQEHRHIVAYCVPASPAAALTASAVRTFCAAALPAYMVPADVVFLEELPMTPNGKVDRQRLPDPARRADAGYRAPANDSERMVAEALADVLRVDRVGVDDNFFDAGGNSLLAVQARRRLLPVLGEGLSLVDIFRYPTARGLAHAFSGHALAGHALSGHGGPGTAEGEGIAGARQAAERRARALARQASVRGERVKPT